MLDAEAASRLCTACGMCCSGVLFEIVKLQSEDSVRDLEKLGMQINRKKTEPYFKQPCRFLEDCTCKIYEQRPTRCRRFACIQLKLLAAGEIDEPAALAKIQEARSQVARIKSELERAGDCRMDASLTERVEQVLNGQPNEELREQMQELQIFLGRHFRTLT